MISSHDFKRKSRGPSDFEHRRIKRSLEEFLTRFHAAELDAVRAVGSELRIQHRDWHVELYRAQPHPVYPDRGVRLPVALLKGSADGPFWKLYFRGQSGHWTAYPDTDSEPDVPASFRLHQVLALLEADPLALFW